MGNQKRDNSKDKVKARIWCVTIENIAPIIRASAELIIAIASVLYLLLR